MNRDDFTKGSVSQILFDYWNIEIDKIDLVFMLYNRTTKKALADFIIEAQSKGCFKGYIHE